MGDQYTLLDQGCMNVVDLEGVMDGHEHDGVISACERAAERRIVRMAITVLEAACYRRKEAEWNSKHMPGAVMPHYLKAGLRDVNRLLVDYPPDRTAAPTAALRFTVRRKGQAKAATVEAAAKRQNTQGNKG